MRFQSRLQRSPQQNPPATSHQLSNHLQAPPSSCSRLQMWTVTLTTRAAKTLTLRDFKHYLRSELSEQTEIRAGRARGTVFHWNCSHRSSYESSFDVLAHWDVTFPQLRVSHIDSAPAWSALGGCPRRQNVRGTFLCTLSAPLYIYRVPMFVRRHPSGPDSPSYHIAIPAVCLDSQFPLSSIWHPRGGKWRAGQSSSLLSLFHAALPLL